MRFVIGFSGGMGDAFMKLYGDRIYNSLNQFSNMGILDAVVCCHNPAIKSVLESMRIFDNIIYHDWDHTCTRHYRNYLSEFSSAVGLSPCSDRIVNSIQLTSFSDGTMHLYDYHIDDKYDKDILDKLKGVDYVVVHPSGGRQDVDGLTRGNYEVLIERMVGLMPNTYVVAVGSNHRRIWVDRDSVSDEIPTLMDGDIGPEDTFHECNFGFTHPRFIDLTNKTSGALCANIVINASSFIGTHSVWINLFWYFKKPTVCIYSTEHKQYWGDRIGYLLNNGCNWGFYMPWCKTISVAPHF